MTAIEFENISKQYRLGLVSTGTLSHDLNRFWQTKVLRREDPYLKVGEVNDRAHKGESEYVWALKDINFKVEQGDVVGIIGRNGAGKSTLLKLLSRVTAPTTGIIRARGRIASLLEVGTGFHPEMTGRENIYMNGAIMGMSRAEITRKLDEIVDFSGCERYLDTPVKRYSSGMTVRLGFAIAAHLEPEILVVDEVLAVGDAEFQKKAIGKMQDVSKGDGRTVLFVSHNMGAVKNLCKTGLLLENGMIKFHGGVDDTINTYIQTNITDFSQHKIVTPSMREKGPTGEITIEEATLLNNATEMGTDEPIEIELLLKKHFGSTTKCKYSVNLFDETDSRIVGYVSKDVPVPQNQNSFKVRLKLTNHSLTQRKYKISLNVGYKDFGSNVQNFDVVKAGVLSFEVKYINKHSGVEYSSWDRNWGAVIHQGTNIEASITQ
ncbi:ABC transporter ATP-binding protein [Fibrobacter sp. UWB13]|uniref:ABC transporter ATP-binding protein n=1 Tax=Fibrobacter sp. UWB13 TaxID=1896204 RepID=UPI000A0CE351|nr:ABC transporter ATP-binding protein [Fibrobacter sp. UWB13]SMG22569.1 ABC-type polysaccharide/polyol phosphate transport system, ATPase component [Fibrobacter sp. UWB13]